MTPIEKLEMVAEMLEQAGHKGDAQKIREAVKDIKKNYGFVDISHP